MVNEDPSNFGLFIAEIGCYGLNYKLQLANLKSLPITLSSGLNVYGIRKAGL